MKLQQDISHEVWLWNNDSMVPVDVSRLSDDLRKSLDDGI